VRANTSWEAYNKVLSAWFSHEEFNGINKEKK
jgi:hypothetical protein